MLENLIFSLDRVMPYFFLIMLGAVFQRSGLVPREFFAKANRFTFRVALPFQLFRNISEIERAGRYGRFMLYVTAVTVVSFLAIWAVTELVFKDKTLVGTLVQGAFRGNFVILGVPLAYSVLGDAGVKIASLTTVILVPIYVILSVFILTLRGTSQKSPSVLGVAKDVITNPIVIGSACGLLFMFFDLRLPAMMNQTVTYIAQTATPLGLLSIGGMINLAHATARLRTALYSVTIKNLIMPVVIMTMSYFLGYRDEEMLVMLLISSTPTSVSSFTMASEMGGDAALASNITIITTFTSAFVLAAGIYLLKTFSLI